MTPPVRPTARGARAHAASLTQLVLLPLGLLATACISDAPQRNTALPDVQIEPPTATATEAHSLPGLHNIVTYTDGLTSGGVPEGDEGFASLAAMGMRTIVSVDGATPDLLAATTHGLRYVHLPISYDTVTPERQRQLAQVIANVERPIYVHCHHGKHRSAAAIGTAIVLAGEMTAAEVEARMHVSGTAASYTGLWAAVREAVPMTAAELRADPASFPSVTKVTGMVATMAEVDQVIDLVRQAHAAGWQAPDDHPDLIATKETGRLAELLASLRSDPESMQYPADYQRMLGETIDLSSRLDIAVQNGNAFEAAKLLTTLGKSCKQCHSVHRNN